MKYSVPSEDAAGSRPVTRVIKRSGGYKANTPAAATFSRAKALIKTLKKSSELIDKIKMGAKIGWENV